MTDDTSVCCYDRTPLAVGRNVCSESVQHIPSRFVVKAFNSDLRYEREKSSYEKVQSLQGDVVPKVYGLVRWHAKNAIAMEFLDGKPLTDAIGDPSQIGHFSNALDYCYERLAELGVCQADPKAGNVMVVELRGLSYLRWLPRMMIQDSFKNILAIRSASMLQLLPIINRIVIIDFDWAYLDDDLADVRNTNRNDAKNIVKQLQRSMAKED